jgi:DNA-binding transcriptional ArsR family regulator
MHELQASGKYPIAETAALFAEPVRAAILVALLDGRSLPASELALIARASPQVASMHLAKLLAGRLVVMTRFGRHRYYKLADAQVARAVEAMGALCQTLRPTQTAPNSAIPPLRIARSCYDHLAGKVAIQICDSLLNRRILLSAEDTFQLTRRGEHWLQDLGIDPDYLRRNRKRPLIRKCLDWTERKFHLAGSLGAALLDHFFTQKLVKREHGSRILRITDAGSEFLKQELGIELE